MLIYLVKLFVPPWLLVIGVSQTLLMVGGFRSKEHYWPCERMKLIPRWYVVVEIGRHVV